MASFFIGLLNLIIKALGAVLNAIFFILPPSPFKLVSNSSVEKYLSNLAWLIPFDSIIAICEIWLVAIGAYYLYQIVLRWIKAIE